MIIDFLETKRPRAELGTALEVIREFKSCQSVEEWAEISSRAWLKLEQLEEYLAHLVDGEPLEADTAALIKLRRRSRRLKAGGRGAA